MVPNMPQKNDMGMALGAVFLPYAYGGGHKRFKGHWRYPVRRALRRTNGVKLRDAIFDDFLIRSV